MHFTYHKLPFDLYKREQQGSMRQYSSTNFNLLQYHPEIKGQGQKGNDYQPKKLLIVKQTPGCEINFFF